MRNLKRAFGSPDAAFQERVRETLFRIEEKEEKPVKKKLTLSMALAFALCLCIVTMSALAASGKLGETAPDVTQQPLSHSEGTPDPENIPDETVWLDDQEEPLYHLNAECTEIKDASALTGMTLSEAALHGGSPCPVCCVIACYEDMDDPTLYHLFSGCPLLKTFTESRVSEMILSGRKLCGGCALLLMNHQGEIGLLASWPELVVSTPMPIPAQTSDMLLPTPEPFSAFSTILPMITAQPEEQETIMTASPVPTLQPGQTEEPVLVWSNEAEAHYHADQDCSETDTPQRVVLAVAINRSQQPCPLCIVESTPVPTVTPTPMPTTTPQSTPTPQPVEQTDAAGEESSWAGNERYSDLCQEYVYAASLDLSGLYHQSPLCIALKGTEDLSMIPMETAVASGKTACPDCTFCFPDPNAPALYHMDAECPAAGDPNIRYATRSISQDETACAECTVYIPDRNTFAGAHASFYHASPLCSDMQQTSPHSREYASMLGLTPCPECLPDEQADTTNADLSGSLGRQAEWMAIDLPSFDADSAITIHSASALRTTGCLYVEFEFTLNDEAIIPSSIQIALTDKEGTELPVLTTALVEPADADGETVYLLCETMAAPEDSFVFDGLTFYGSTDPEVREPLGPS